MIRASRALAASMLTSLLVASPAVAADQRPDAVPPAPPPSAAPGIAVPSAVAIDSPAPNRIAPERFGIAAFDVTGVSKLDAGAVENAVYPFAGPDRTVADVEAARKALEDAYKSRGFEAVVVEIPPQPSESFVSGVVLLKVTEATIGRLRVTGSKYHAPSVVLRQVPALQEGGVPDLTAAQTQLTEANRFPDREVTPSIRAGRVPGTIDVDLRVKDSLPLHGSVELNNDHNSATVPLRLSASVRYTNVWQVGHTVSASYLVAPEDRSQLEVFSGSYVAPIEGSRWTILAYGYTSNSNVAALGGTQVLGNGFAVGARGIYRLPGTREQTLSFGIDYKDFKEDIAIPAADPDDDDEIIQTPIAYVPLVLGYTSQWVGERSATNLTVGVTAGLRGFASGEDVVQVRRFDAVGNFVHFNVEADYTRALGGDFSAYGKVVGQLADSALVTNEQFSIGGITSVRGYFQSEAVGDDGVNWIVEARSASLFTGLGGFLDEFRVFAFSDGGFVRVRSPLPDQASEFTLVSIGAGARFQLFRYFKGNIAYGHALLDGTATPAGEGQFTFSVKAEF